MSGESELIYSEVPVGKLLRHLNRMCKVACEAGSHDIAAEAADLSSKVEEALVFSGLADSNPSKT